MFCSNCGTKISDDAAFCFHCGAPVEQDVNQVSSKSAAKNQLNNKKKPVIIGACCSIAILAVCLLCVVLLTRTLSADHSETSVTASRDSDSIEGKSANVSDDNHGEEAVADDGAVVVSDEAYIERLEAYQEYYNSIKDEDENYEVLAAISLDENNLPIMWLGYADADELEVDEDMWNRHFNGYLEVYGYEKKEVTLLLETPRYYLKNAMVVLTNSGLVFGRTSSANDSDNEVGDYWYAYDKDSNEFVQYNDEDEDLARCFDIGSSYYITNKNTGLALYYGYRGAIFSDTNKITGYGDFWWDGSEMSLEERGAMLDLYSEDISSNFADVYIMLLEEVNFDVLIRDLKDSPIYDIKLLAVRYYAYYREYDDETVYRVEYLDLDNLDEYLAK